MSESCGICKLIEGPGALPAIWEDARWRVQPIGQPWGLAGWMMLIAKRHVAGPAHFDDAEAASFGPILRHLERVLERTTGALRIYTAALGESHPHFHCHMVPRSAQMPKDAKGWAVFDLERAARAGEIPLQTSEMERLIEEYRRVLRDDPPPRI